MKILYFDTETTGIDPKVHEITQFAALIEIDGKVKEEVNWRCQPTRWDQIDQGAIETTGVSIEQLKTFDPPKVMAEKMRQLFDQYIDKYDKTDKFYPAGHNIAFDLDFLQAFWQKYLDKYGTGSYQNWRTLDSRVFANFLAAKGILKTDDLKLSTICAEFGIKIKAHDALSDIRATRKLIHAFMEFLK